jgi:hypothetical protein
VALTALAGARRTDTAVPRFVAYNMPDVGGFLHGNVFSPPVEPGVPGNSLSLAPVEQRVVDLPQVAAYFRAPYLFLATDPAGNTTGSLNAIGPADAALFRSVDRPRVVAGRLPNPSRSDEAVINDLAAKEHHFRVGSTVRLYAYSFEQFSNGGLTSGLSTRARAPAGPTFTVQITGIVRFPSDVSAIVPIASKQDVSYEGQQNLYLSPAFLPRLAAGLGIPVRQIPSMNLFGVRLRHGAADWSAFAAAATAIGNGVITPSPGDVYGTRTAAASAERGVHLEVVALLFFGALAAIVTIVLVGQAIARQVTLQDIDYASLRSLGATRSQLVGIALVRGAVIGLGGSALGLMVAVVASPLMPLGLARQAEIHPGFEANLAVLVPAALGIAALTAVWSAGPVRRASRIPSSSVRDDDADFRPSRLAAALARSSFPPSAIIGVRFGLERGRGRSAVPVVTAVVGAVVAVAALVAALTFGSSLEHMVNSPRQQGWNWDVIVGNPNDQTDREVEAGALLARNPLVGSYSAFAILAGPNQGTAQIDGKTVDALLAIDPLKGSVYPPVLLGHEPRAANEIVLASATLRQLHRQVGEFVHIPTPSGVQTLRIVGEMIAPSFGDILTNGVGDGAWIYGPVVRQVQAQAPPQANGLPPIAFVLFAVRYAPGASQAAAYASLRHDFGRTVLGRLPSADAINLRSVDRLPLLLAGLIVLIGLMTVGNTLVTSVHQRRRDLAILKTIGFVRRQVAGCVAWQAMSFVVVAVLLGVPLGLAAGHWAWDLAASNINSMSPVLVPTLAIATIVPAALAWGIVISALPSWSAAQVRPAVVMRSE